MMNNKLIGSFFDLIAKISIFNIFILLNNKIFGSLLDLSSLSRLKVLDLSGNRLELELFNLFGGLFMVLLNNNFFVGYIL